MQLPTQDFHRFKAFTGRAGKPEKPVRFPGHGIFKRKLCHHLLDHGSHDNTIRLVGETGISSPGLPAIFR
jgi:hypothetical protein